MHYILCPRCQFKVPANKHICQTCGFQIPSAAPTNGGNVQSSNKIGNPFARLLKLQNQEGKPNEGNQENPALS